MARTYGRPEDLQFNVEDLIFGKLKWLSYKGLPQDKFGFIERLDGGPDVFCVFNNACGIVHTDGKYVFTSDNKLGRLPQPGERIAFLLTFDRRERPCAERWTLTSQWEQCLAETAPTRKVS